MMHNPSASTVVNERYDNEEDNFLTENRSQAVTTQSPSTSQHWQQSSNTAISQQELKEFEKQCLFNIDRLYGNWRENIFGEPTICIPEFVDVDDRFIQPLDPTAVNYGDKFTTNAASSGHLAERVVHKAFQISNIGGMLIHGIRFGEVWKTLFESKNLNSSTALAGDSMAIDFLFFHPAFGIHILEFKPMNVISETAYIQFEQNLKRTVRSLLQMFQIFTGVDCPQESVHALLCFPNATKSLIERKYHLNILDQTDLKEPSNFAKFWKHRTEQKCNEAKSIFINESISRFTAIIFGIRSAKFIIASNALEAEIINTEYSQQSSTSLAPFGSRTIFFNCQQLSAYEMAKRGNNVFLLGPLGAGKTLLMMVLAKEAAATNRPGRVVVFLQSNELAQSYENYFNANRSGQKRVIVINPSERECQTALAAASYDDIFADELSSEKLILQSVRRNGQIVASVSTTCNGSETPNQASSIDAKTKFESRLSGMKCVFITLDAVMSGTVRLFGYCQRMKIDENGARFREGSNINGRFVELIRAKNIDDVSAQITTRINQLIKHNKFSLMNMAIIIAHDPISSQISYLKNELDKNGIATGSIAEQLKSADIIAIESSADVCLLEWPVVFVINASNCPVKQRAIAAYSRAEEQLFVFETTQCNGRCTRKSALPSPHFNSHQTFFNDRLSRIQIEPQKLPKTVVPQKKISETMVNKEFDAQNFANMEQARIGLSVEFREWQKTFSTCEISSKNAMIVFGNEISILKEKYNAIQQNIEDQRAKLLTNTVAMEGITTLMFEESLKNVVRAKSCLYEQANEKLRAFESRRRKEIVENVDKSALNHGVSHENQCHSNTQVQSCEELILELEVNNSHPATLEIDEINLMSAVKDNIANFCFNLANVEILVMLEAEKIFSIVDCQLIRTEKTEFMQNYYLIQFLMKKGTTALRTLIKVLRQTHQHHLADLLEPQKNPTPADPTPAPTTLKIDVTETAEEQLIGDTEKKSEAQTNFVENKVTIGFSLNERNNSSSVNIEMAVKYRQHFWNLTNFTSVFRINMTVNRHLENVAHITLLIFNRFLDAWSRKENNAYVDDEDID